MYLVNNLYLLTLEFRETCIKRVTVTKVSGFQPKSLTLLRFVRETDTHILNYFLTLYFRLNRLQASKGQTQTNKPKNPVWRLTTVKSKKISNVLSLTPICQHTCTLCSLQGLRSRKGGKGSGAATAGYGSSLWREVAGSNRCAGYIVKGTRVHLSLSLSFSLPLSPLFLPPPSLSLSLLSISTPSLLSNLYTAYTLRETPTPFSS